MTITTNDFSEKGLFRGDGVVWMIFICLCLISVVEVYSACSNMSYASGDYWRPVLDHAAYVGMGFMLAWIIHLIPSNLFKIACFFFLFILALPLQVSALFTDKVNDASRWVEIGGKTIQPAEFVKICLVGTVALLMSYLRDEKGMTKVAFWAISGISALFVLLILPENASTAAIIAVVMLCMLIIGKAPAKYLAWIGGLAAGGILLLVVAYSLMTPERLKAIEESTVLHRVPTWVNRIKSAPLPEDPADYNVHENLQKTHAKIAVATCGITGKGPGNSVERDYLPQAYSDFIYSIIIEEGGIAFGTFVMALYLLLMWRAYKIAQQCKLLFPAFLVMGLTLMLVVQAMMNMAVATGAFPITGQPLPLISRGGTSTFISCAYIGMILSVSHTARKKKTVAKTAASTNVESSNDKTDK